MASPAQNMRRIKEQKITDWELGNEILFKVIDACSSLSVECKETHPEVSMKLDKMRKEACEIYRELVKEGALV